VKIRWLEVTNFRKFVGTVHVSGIGERLNVLVGPNEMGKSTLMEAINGVIFQKANSQNKEVKSFRHLFNETVPEVSLGFDLDGKSWTVKKRFAGAGGKAWLQSSDGRRCEGEAAEAELQRLFGFTTSGRSVEPGIWGTLWVRQRCSFGDPALNDQARHTVHDCLETQVGAVTGGARGQRIPKAVEAALDQLVSQRGAPRGRYKAASEQLAELRQRIAGLEQKRLQLFEEMDRLASLKRELQLLEQDWDEEENTNQIAAARERRAEAERRATEITAARSAALLAAEKANNSRAESRKRLALIAEINRIENAVIQLRLRAEAAEQMKSRDTAALAAREQGLRQLLDGQRENTQTERRLHRIRETIALAAELDHCQAIASQIAASQNEAEQLGEEIGHIRATTAAIARIDQAEVELAAASAAREAVATTVALAIEPTAVERITIDGVPLADPSLTRSILDDYAICIAGIGEIAVRPQIRDRTTLLRRIEHAERALQDALAETGADTPASARAAADRRRELEHRLEAFRKVIGQLAPGDKKTGLAPGLDPLKVRMKELRARRDEEMGLLELDALPERATVERELAGIAAQAAKLAADIDIADADLQVLNASAENSRAECEAVERELAAEERDLQTKIEMLAEGRSRLSDDRLAAEAEEMERAAAQRQSALMQLQETAGETVEDINAQITRLENAAHAYRDQVTQLRTEIAGSSATITANEGDGIEEELENARGEESRLINEIENFEREVKVLRLLRETLRGAESEAKARYLGPVTTRVQPYLRALLPGTDLHLDENLHIASLMRNGIGEEFTKLSEGTQEQIAVLTRLAFAELLLDQGRPATVILDDALVFSDDERIERMFDIMTRAAERVQIIVLTCRRRLFTRLGARMLNVESREAALAA
jgi:energy-coupling factor transporter ATP-binding protein EcfA2